MDSPRTLIPGILTIHQMLSLSLNTQQLEKRWLNTQPWELSEGIIHIPVYTPRETHLTKELGKTTE